MPEKVKNISTSDECAACIDGWVELAGTITVGGHTYSRGMAPCKWCELGDRRYTHATDPAKPGGRWQPEHDFDGSDIVPPAQPGRNFRPNTAFLRERAAAGDSIPALQAMFPRSMWPSEWGAAPPPRENPLLDDEDAEIAEKQRKAQIALETAQQEPVSADEAPAQIAQHVPAEADVPY